MCSHKPLPHSMAPGGSGWPCGHLVLALLRSAPGREHGLLVEHELSPAGLFRIQLPSAFVSRSAGSRGNGAGPLARWTFGSLRSGPQAFPSLVPRPQPEGQERPAPPHSWVCSETSLWV